MTSRDHDDPGNDNHDAPRDARLLAALRHAPDRDAVPPPEVTARILAAARDAVRPAPAPLSWAQRLAAWLQPPQLGAAFGTIAVAVLVGMMWSTREAPEAFEPGATAAPPLDAAAGAGEATKPSADAAQDADPSKERAAPAEALRDAAPADLAKARRNAAPAPAPAAPKAKGERQAADAARTEARARGVDAAPAAPPSLPPPAAAPVQQAPVQSREADAAPAAASPPPAQAVPEPAPAKRQGAAVSAAPPPPRLRADELKLLLEQRAEAGAASTPATPIAGRLAAKADSSVALDPLQRIEAVLNGADASLRAAWHSASASARAHGSAQQAWWRELRAATQGRWQRATESQPADAPWLMLTVDGRTSARWWFDGELLLLSDADGRLWRTALTEAQRRAWQQAVAGW